MSETAKWRTLLDEISRQVGVAKLNFESARDIDWELFKALAAEIAQIEAEHKALADQNAEMNADQVALHRRAEAAEAALAGAHEKACMCFEDDVDPRCATLRALVRR